MNLVRFSIGLIFFFWVSGIANLCFALDVKLDSNRDYIEVIHDNEVIKVQRVQDVNHIVSGGFAKTSRKCPPFCIQPMQVASGVNTIGELEVFSFMESKLLDGSGVLIDARMPEWHQQGTIPGSINIPFTVFSLEPDALELIEAMETLGVNRRGEASGITRGLEKVGLLSSALKNEYWNFTNAKDIVIWCNGPWCGQSPRAIQALLELGYPPAKLNYYRGGMQLWQIFGLTTVIPK